MNILGSRHRTICGTAIGLSTLFNACAHRPIPALPSAEMHDASKLWAALEARAQTRHEISGSGKAKLQAPGRDHLSVAVNIAARRPADLRFEALSFFGDPAALLITARGHFVLYDIRKPMYYDGRATAENLARLLPVAIDPEELVDLLLETAPPLADALPTSVEEAGDDFVLRLSTANGVEEKIRVAADLRLRAVERLAWQASFDDSTLRITGGGASMELSLSSETLDPQPPLPESAFAVGAPPGVPVERLP